MLVRALVVAATTAALAACPDDQKETGNGQPDGPGGGPGADAGPGGGDVDGGTVDHPVTALSKSTFVFRRSHSLTEDYLYAYDAAAQSERLVTDLVDNGSGSLVSGHAISPDRKSLAFTAIFRVEPADIVSGSTAQALWVVGVDGQGFRRLSPPLPNTDTGAECTSNDDCQSPTHCGPTNHCRLGNSVNDVRDPAWAVDGSTLAFNIGNFGSAPDGTPIGGTYPWAISAAGGFPEPLMPVQGCTIVSALAAEPSGTGFVANHQICLPSTDPGLYMHPFGGGSPVPLVTAKMSSIDVVQDTPSWIEDGSAFFFVGSAMMPIGGEMTYGTGGFAYITMDKSTRLIVAPPSKDAFVQGIAAARDLTFIAYCLRSSGGDDIYVVDLRNKPPTTFQATHDGKSCFPRF